MGKVIGLIYETFSRFAVFVALTAFGLSSVQASEKIVIVEVESYLHVAAYLKKIGFYDIRAHPERLQSVPRTGILRIPKVLTDEWRNKVQLRKSVFFRLGVSAALQVNEQILAQRNRLQRLSLNDLSGPDRIWLSALLVRYGVMSAKEEANAKHKADALLRVDALPPSMVMAQAAIESGWAQSRFARLGQAIFGQWTSRKDGIKALDSKVRLSSFKSPRDSMIAYMLNVNSHPAYAELRRARAEMRRMNKPFDGYILAGYLGAYAETGVEYVALIRKIIRRNELTLADTAELGPGPNILFRRLDQN